MGKNIANTGVASVDYAQWYWAYTAFINSQGKVDSMSQEKNIESVLNTLVSGTSATVTLSSSVEVGIKVCNGETLPMLMRFAAKVSKDLGLSLKDAEGIKDKLLAKVDDVSFILELLADYTDDVYSLIGQMTTLGTREAVSSLPADDILNVASKVVEVNATFFTNRVLPLLTRMQAPQGR